MVSLWVTPFIPCAKWPHSALGHFKIWPDKNYSRSTHWPGSTRRILAYVRMPNFKFLSQHQFRNGDQFIFLFFDSDLACGTVPFALPPHSVRTHVGTGLGFNFSYHLSLFLSNLLSCSYRALALNMHYTWCQWQHRQLLGLRVFWFRFVLFRTPARSALAHTHAIGRRIQKRTCTYTCYR